MQLEGKICTLTPAFVNLRADAGLGDSENDRSAHYWSLSGLMERRRTQERNMSTQCRDTLYFEYRAVSPSWQGHKILMTLMILVTIISPGVVLWVPSP